MLRRLSYVSSITIAIIALSALAATPAHATIRTFNLAWSGDFFGNGASATGTIVIDDTLFPNPGSTGVGVPAASIGIQSFTMTVVGASSGNGTFTLADFDGGVDWDTAGATLDLSSELVGQPTPGSPWGTFGADGDFNLFSNNPGVPNGVIFYALATSGGTADPMLLTSFAPSSAAAPEPGSLALLGMTALPLVGIVRRRKV